MLNADQPFYQRVIFLNEKAQALGLGFWNLSHRGAAYDARRSAASPTFRRALIDIVRIHTDTF